MFLFLLAGTELSVYVLAHELGLGDDLPVHQGPALLLPDVALALHRLDVQLDAIAGDHRPAEPRVVDGREVGVSPGSSIIDPLGEERRGLGQRLEEERAGHDPGGRGRWPAKKGSFTVTHFTATSVFMEYIRHTRSTHFSAATISIAPTTPEYLNPSGAPKPARFKSRKPQTMGNVYSHAIIITCQTITIEPKMITGP